MAHRTLVQTIAMPEQSSEPSIRLYFITLRADAFALAEVLDPVFEEEVLTTALFEDPDDTDNWQYGIYCEADDETRVRGLVADALGENAPASELLREEITITDWVSETLRDLAPVHAGRFTVHGGHDAAAVANRPITVQVDAGLAFGTGHHGTTAGCLMMLEKCLRRSSSRPLRLRSALDVGTGSGVLAIALAKALRIPVLATDIDPVATDVARDNCRLNGVASDVICETATGFEHPCFARFGDVDLVFANILAGPLQQLAKPMVQHLNSGAHVILSGLLPHQKTRLVARYRSQGLVFDEALIHNGWLTLLMRKA
ncbi:ribosomal protein L11 methyltransferase [Ahrensia sp. R2A130]|nr:ribosomal protein L11 methyltransferase [Ahrensia sp. R2A130]